MEKLRERTVMLLANRDIIWPREELWGKEKEERNEWVEGSEWQIPRLVNYLEKGG